jgi:tetratricopeptide (TPR) repeat protein/DNA-binding winged helix-turn-helix (wHTH) protein
MFLIERPDRVVTKEEVVEALWKDTAVTDNSISQCVIELRKMLGDDARKPRYIRTIPRSGFRLIAPVELAAETIEVTSVEVRYEAEMTAQEARELAGFPKTKTAVAMLCLGTIAALMLFVAARTGGPAPNRKTVSVMSFENESADRQWDWLSGGLADAMMVGLSHYPGLNVVGRRQARMEAERMGLADPAHPPLADLFRIARKFRSDQVLLGSFARIGGSIRLTVELHEASSGNLIGAETVVAEDAEHLLSRADALSLKLAERLGQHANAKRLAEPVAGTNNLEAYHAYTLALDKANAYHSHEAIELLEKAIALDPRFVMARARIGYIYAVTWGLGSRGKPYLETAFRESAALGEKDRMYIAAWYAIAGHDYTGAIGRLRSLIASYPEEIEAYLRLGHLLRGEERYREAVEVLEQGLLFDGQAQDLCNALGGLYTQLGRHRDAVEMQAKYVAMAPREANSHDSLALAYQWAGRFPEAGAEYAAALELDPRFQVSVVNLGNLYYQQGRYADAVRQYRRYLELVESDAERARGWGSLACVYRRMGDRRQEEDAAAQELQFDATASGPSLLLAAERGDRATEEKLARALFLLPDYSHRGARTPTRTPHWYLAQAALGRRDFPAAERHCRDALRHWPPLGGMESGETCLADVLLQSGRNMEAVAEYRRALAIYPGEAPGYLSLSRALERTGRSAEAADALGKYRALRSEADAGVQDRELLTVR